MPKRLIRDVITKSAMHFDHQTSLIFICEKMEGFKTRSFNDVADVVNDISLKFMTFVIQDCSELHFEIWNNL